MSILLVIQCEIESSSQLRFPPKRTANGPKLDTKNKAENIIL